LIHRHINATRWTRSAIDSALEHGDLADWRELFARVRRDRALAAEVPAVCRAHRVEGASALAETLVLETWPELRGVAPSRE